MKTGYEIYFTTFYKRKNHSEKDKYKTNMKALVIAENVTEAISKLQSSFDDAEVHQISHVGKHYNFVFIE